MPTLEDTVEFKAITLNDLLEADAKSGVGPVGGDDSKYRLWFLVSSAAAGIFAVLFVAALITGGKSSGGSGSAAKLPPNTRPASVTVPESQVVSGIGPNSEIAVLKGNTVLIGSAKVIKIRDGGTAIGSTGKLKIVEFAVTEPQQLKLTAAGAKGLSITSGPLQETASTEAPPATTQATTPAGESPTPAPAPSPNS